MTSSKDFFVSLEWVWRFSPNSLQPGSKLTKKSLSDIIFQKNIWKKRKKWVWRISKLSPNSLQTKKICVHNFFFEKNMRSTTQKNQKKLWTHIFFEFGESLEIIFSQFFQKKETIKKKSIKDFFVSLEWVWRFSKLAPNSYVFIVFCYFIVSLEKRNEFGVSLEILQTLPKLAPSSYVLFFPSFVGEERNEFGVSLESSKLTSNWLQTQMISFLRVLFLYCFFSCLFGKDERFRSEFGDYPNSPQTRSKFICFHFSVVIFFSIYFFLNRRDAFGVGLEILQTLSKLICFLIILFFLWKRGMSLEWLWRFSKLSPNSVQTHSKLMFFFCYVTTEKLLVQETLQSSASSACSAVYELLETSPPRVTPEKQEFGLWVGKGLTDHRLL